jgi:hypothetical protein
MRQPGDEPGCFLVDMEEVIRHPWEEKVEIRIPNYLVLGLIGSFLIGQPIRRVWKPAL